MSGHNKWSTIKHKKGKADAARGKVFTKLQREITVAAKAGGGDPNYNPSLRTAMERARAASMPKTNIENAIKKGTGELASESYEAKTYEGYGPGGTALVVDVLTDNANRAVAEIKNIFSKKGGNLAAPGAVAWQFERKGLIVISAEKASEDAVLEATIDAGADDVSSSKDTVEVVCAPDAFEAVKTAIQGKGWEWESADLTMLAKEKVQIDESSAKQVLALMEALDDNDDVQNVYSNFDISDEVMAKLSA
jgi:YebC/PmpR family DNA-binding regulatory protein